MKKIIIFLIVILFVGQLCFFGKQNGMNIFKLNKVCESKPLFNFEVAWVTDMCIDNNGFVFILNSSNRKIIKFSPELKFMKSFGKKGQGPGEFNWAFKLSLDSAGNLYVFENMVKVIKFSGNGEFIAEQKFGDFVSESSGRIIDYPVFAGTKLGKKYKYKLLVFDISRKKVLNEHEIIQSGNYAISMGGRIIAPSIPFAGGHSFIESNGKYCLVGEGQRFFVRLIDKRGEIIAQVKREQEAEKLSSSEKKFLVEDIMKNLPGNKKKSDVEKLISNYKTKNYIHKLLISENRFFIFTVPDNISVQNKFPVEIYDFKGKFIKKGFFPKVPIKISKNHAYINEKTETEDDEIIRIVKYKIEYN